MQYKWFTYLMNVTNLAITIAVILFLLPASVPVHINSNLVIDAMGSPLLSILPFALLPLILNSITVIMRDNGVDGPRAKTYRIRDIFVAIYSVISIVAGWLMFSIAYSGGMQGMTLDISLMLVICLIPGLVLFIVSAYLPTLNKRGKGIHFTWMKKDSNAWSDTQRLAYIMGISLSTAIYATIITCYLLGLYKVGFLICGVILLMYLILLLVWSVIYSQSTEVKDIEEEIPSTKTEENPVKRIINTKTNNIQNRTN